jgi:hypothetical protein
MDDLPENVLGFTAKGTVTAEDYESTIIPAVEEVLSRHRKVRLLYHLGEEFSGFEAGALWDDAKVGLRHPTAWERVAVVSDAEWVRMATKVFGFAMPAQVRVYHNREMATARAWVCEDA